MSHGVPLLNWRNGRPRWEPGPTRRKEGYRGKNLQDENGHWLTLEGAKIAAQQINEQIGIMPRAEKLRPLPVEKPSLAKIGFLYFMRSGDAVKIGWSKNPFVRMRELLTGNPLGFTSIIAIRAWPEDERKLHREWRAYRIHGEWFRAAPPVLALMERIGQRAAAGATLERSVNGPLITEAQSDDPIGLSEISMT